MGDRYTLRGLKCGKCGYSQDEVYYAESSGFITHRCEVCKQLNAIVQGFYLVPISPKEEEELLKAHGFE